LNTKCQKVIKLDLLKPFTDQLINQMSFYEEFDRHC
jgi:hypothetical protein